MRPIDAPKYAQFIRTIYTFRRYELAIRILSRKISYSFETTIETEHNRKKLVSKSVPRVRFCNPIVDRQKIEEQDEIG